MKTLLIEIFIDIEPNMESYIVFLLTQSLTICLKLLIMKYLTKLQYKISSKKNFYGKNITKVTEVNCRASIKQTDDDFILKPTQKLLSNVL